MLLRHALYNYNRFPRLLRTGDGLNNARRTAPPVDRSLFPSGPVHPKDSRTLLLWALNLDRNHDLQSSANAHAANLIYIFPSFFFGQEPSVQMGCFCEV